MAWRLGPGPVFAYERLAGSRRWQAYAVRALFVGMLLVGMTVTWAAMVGDRGVDAVQKIYSLRDYAEMGQKYGYGLIGIQLSLVLLAAPAATAGAICLDKARGNLTLMLATDLSNAEVLLGKLAARLVPVLGLIACAWPVIGLGTLLGGLDPEAMGLAFLVTVDVAILGCALALTLSVWAVKVHEALMATYLFWCVVALAYPTWDMLARARTGVGAAPRWLLSINPFWLAYAPSASPAWVGWGDYVLFTLGCAGFSGAPVALATVLFRRAVLRQAAKPAKSSQRWVLPDVTGVFRDLVPGPSLDGNPVLWREWHRNQPSNWGRVIWTTCALGSTVLGLWGVIDVVRNGIGTGPVLAVLVVVLLVFIGFLLLSASTATSLTEERVRGSLDALMTTPLSTWEIVWGKWWGAYRAVPWLAFWPAAQVAAMASAERVAVAMPPGWIAPAGYEIGPGVRIFAVLFVMATVLAHGALLASLGLALATWIKKQGRAMALVVTAYLLIAVGWPILMIVLFKGPGTHEFVEGLTELSPVFATANVAASFAHRNGQTLFTNLGWGLWWLVLVSATAVGFLLATWKTFDRCLGRMPEELDYAALFAGAVAKSSAPRGAKDAGVIGGVADGRGDLEFGVAPEERTHGLLLGRADLQD
jgi:ABC-type transport system involved in multi-copper enzyme maturation permease subunit